MKTKFETNVAQEMPKTRQSQEPGLPWKLDPEDLEKSSSGNEVYKSAASVTPPLKTRPIFLILLLATIFVAVMYFVSLIVADNEFTRSDIQKKELTMSSLQTSLEKINTQKNALNANLGQLEKRVNDLNAQKELFATVIESLTKKTDDPQAQNAADNNDKAALQETQGVAAQTTQSAASQATQAANPAQVQETKSVQ